MEQGPDLKAPDCSVKQTEKHKQAYCAGRGIATATPLTATEVARVRAALDRMRAKGGICATLAAIGDTVFNNNKVRFYPQSTFQFQGSAVRSAGANSEYTWVPLSDRNLQWYDAAHASKPDLEGNKHTLQSSLAHELDHLNGEGPAPGSVGQTKNSLACSDLTP